MVIAVIPSSEVDITCKIAPRAAALNKMNKVKKLCQQNPRTVI